MSITKAFIQKYLFAVCLGAEKNGFTQVGAMRIYGISFQLSMILHAMLNLPQYGYIVILLGLGEAL